MKLPKITTKQQAILQLLYRYRFLNRIQIQTLMHHKDYKTINVWLKDLREKEFVTWIYSTDFMEKSKPAVYYLGINGIRFLKTTDEYPLGELRKRYREDERSESFIVRSKLIADSCIVLEAKSSEKTRYAWHTQADYADPGSDYHFLAEADGIQPQLHYTEQQKGNIMHYLLEVIDPALPQHRLRKRLKNYVNYMADEDWEGDADEPLIVRLVLPTTYLLIYAKRAIRKMLEDVWDEDNVDIWLTTMDKLKKHGLLSNVWETTKRKKSDD
jgi:hypothetical protein